MLDRFPSGLIAGLRDDQGPAAAIQWGAADDALTMTTQGATSMAPIAEILKLATGGSPRVDRKRKGLVPDRRRGVRHGAGLFAIPIGGAATALLDRRRGVSPHFNPGHACGRPKTRPLLKRRGRLKRAPSAEPVVSFVPLNKVTFLKRL